MPAQVERRETREDSALSRHSDGGYGDRARQPGCDGAHTRPAEHAGADAARPGHDGQPIGIAQWNSDSREKKMTSSCDVLIRRLQVEGTKWRQERIGIRIRRRISVEVSAGEVDDDGGTSQVVHRRGAELRLGSVTLEAAFAAARTGAGFAPEVSGGISVGAPP